MWCISLWRFNWEVEKRSPRYRDYVLAKPRFVLWSDRPFGDGGDRLISLLCSALDPLMMEASLVFMGQAFG